MYQYIAYGIGFHSEIVLPELLESETDADITVKLSSIDQVDKLAYTNTDKPITYIKISREEIILNIKNLGIFQIVGGKEVCIDPLSDASIRLIQLCITGSIMGILLYQRGYHALHAGAINISGQAIVFIGESGRGKSSMIASFVSYGYRLIADDIIPVDLKKDCAIVHCGYPQIKIGLELAEVLGIPSKLLRPLHPKLEKYTYNVKPHFEMTSLPLGKIYILDEGDEIKIEQISPQTAIVELIRHSYGSHALYKAFSKDFYISNSIKIHERVPIYRLRRPNSLSLLPEIIRLIERKSV